MPMLDITCDNCSSVFQRHSSEINRIKGRKYSFCSRKCGVEFKQKQILYHDFTCLNCDEAFQRTDRVVKNMKRNGHEIKFCSKKCKSDYWGKNRLEVKCSVCSKKYLKQPKDVHNNNYCSSECYEAYKKTLQTEVSCIVCNSHFFVLNSTLENIHKAGSEKTYCCSDECYDKHIEFKYQENTCKQCGEGFRVLKSKANRRFCTQKCRVDYWNAHHRIEKVCQECGEPFITRASYLTKQFCSTACRKTFQTRKREEYDKISSYLRSKKEYEIWRDKVLSSANYTCVECKDDKDKLHAHHIYELIKICEDHKYDIEAIRNSEIFNDPSNGQCLCSICHQKKHIGIIRNENGTFCRLSSIRKKRAKIISGEIR